MKQWIHMENSIEKAMLPFKMQQLLDIIIQKKKFGIEDALQYLYSSDLYQQLSSASSSLWQYSGMSLYDLLKKEKLSKKQQQNAHPSILLFIAFCLENYKEHKQIPAEEALFIFKKHDVLTYLEAVYEQLHTQGKAYIIEEIELYIRNKK